MKSHSGRHPSSGGSDSFDGGSWSIETLYDIFPRWAMCTNCCEGHREQPGIQVPSGELGAGGKRHYDVRETSLDPAYTIAQDPPERSWQAKYSGSVPNLRTMEPERTEAGGEQQRLFYSSRDLHASHDDHRHHHHHRHHQHGNHKASWREHMAHEQDKSWSFLSRGHIDTVGEWAAEGEGGEWVSDERGHLRFREHRPLDSDLARHHAHPSAAAHAHEPPSRGGWMPEEVFKVARSPNEQVRVGPAGGSRTELHEHDHAQAGGRFMHGEGSSKRLIAFDHQHHMARFH